MVVTRKAKTLGPVNIIIKTTNTIQPITVHIINDNLGHHASPNHRSGSVILTVLQREPTKNRNKRVIFSFIVGYGI